MMNVNLLIDAIVRQTVVLIAQLATSAGVRAPIAHIANQIFLDLSDELANQGLGRKLIADMFGMSLRTYHAKVRRLSESVTQRGQSLWEAVLGYIHEQSSVSRVEVLRRFRYDDEAMVKSVLIDLVDNGFAFKSGRGDATVYKAVEAEDMGAPDPNAAQEAVTALVQVVLHGHGPMTQDALLEHVRLDDVMVKEALRRLLADGQINAVEGSDPLAYECDHFLIPIGSPVGWEAALFDHYQALVTALCRKLRVGARQSRWRDATGGSTYAFDIWPGHPLEEEIMGLLDRSRREATRLREAVSARQHERPTGLAAEDELRVVFYVGQTVLDDEVP